MDPAPGPRRTVATTPELRASAIRRTTSIDVTRPDGLLGRVTILVGGRDAQRAADGALVTVDEVDGRFDLDPRDGTITAATVHTSHAAAPELVGLSVRKGWGRAVSAAFPIADRSLLYSVLEDLGGAFLVSGYALLRGGALAATVDDGAARAQAQQDVCIGWAEGGDVVEVLRATGSNAVPQGPGALPTLVASDQWHDLPEPAPQTVRRIRRLDVAATASGCEVHAHFRDTYASDEPEMVMHEYLVDARVDGEGRIAEVDVDPRVLPWDTCPGAVASARHVVGVALDEIAATVRRELHGPTTCTHLTSTLRSLADADHLLRFL